MIPEEFSRYVRGVPNHIVVAVVNSLTHGVNWTGCGKTMICEDWHKWHGMKNVSASAFHDSIEQELQEFKERRVSNKARHALIMSETQARVLARQRVKSIALSLENGGVLGADDQAFLTAWIKDNV